MRITALAVAGAALGALAGCGSSTPSQPNPSPTPTLMPTPTPTPPGIVLPPGMTCSPTPPPLYGIKVSIFADSGDRKILDTRPIVANVDGYCARVGTGGATQTFCDTRTEPDPQRTACDYLVMGISPATGRWGPTWTWDGKPCGGENFTSCANSPTNQFQAIAKAKGKYEACASSEVPVAPGGSACGGKTIK